MILDLLLVLLLFVLVILAERPVDEPLEAAPVVAVPTALLENLKEAQTHTPPGKTQDDDDDDEEEENIERRIDDTTGKAMMEDEFVETYGKKIGRKKWQVAKKQYDDAFDAAIPGSKNWYPKCWDRWAHKCGKRQCCCNVGTVYNRAKETCEENSNKEEREAEIRHHQIEGSTSENFNCDDGSTKSQREWYGAKKKDVKDGDMHWCGDGCCCNGGFEYDADERKCVRRGQAGAPQKAAGAAGAPQSSHHGERDWRLHQDNSMSGKWKDVKHGGLPGKAPRSAVASVAALAVVLLALVEDSINLLPC